MRISDWSSDVCSSDLAAQREAVAHLQDHLGWASGGRAVSLMQTARACGIARSEAMMPSCGSNCANWHSSVGGSAIDVYTSCSGATASRSTGRKTRASNVKWGWQAGGGSIAGVISAPTHLESHSSVDGKVVT